MAAPATAQPPPPLLIRMNEEALPRPIQLVMAIVWSRSTSSSTTTAASVKTIGDDIEEDGRLRILMWVKFVLGPFVFVIIGHAAVADFYATLCDDETCRAGRELISSSGPGGFCFLAIAILLHVYWAVLQAAGGHLGLFAPRTPCVAWEAFDQGMFGWMGFILILTSIGVMLLVFLNQTWPLLVVWTCLLGLLVASVVAFWLCLLRIYGGERRRDKNSCGEAVIDGLAYLYCRLLYEYAVRFHAVADADAGNDMQQHLLDASLV